MACTPQWSGGTELRQETELAYKPSSLALRLHVPKVLQPPNTTGPYRDQVFNHKSWCRTFHSQTITLAFVRIGDLMESGGGGQGVISGLVNNILISIKLRYFMN